MAVSAGRWTPAEAWRRTVLAGRIGAIVGVVVLIACYAGCLRHQVRMGNARLLWIGCQLRPKAIDATDANGLAPLHIAVVRRDWKAFYVLLACGADPNAHGPNGITPLHLACGVEEFVEPLLAAGANPNAKCFGGITVLHNAASQSSARTIELLLRHGAAREARDDGWGRTPLDLARQHGDPAVIAALTESGRPN